MKPYLSDPDFTLWNGDVREVLRELPADSVDCALTSPPFFGLRDYGVENQIGLEATPDLWVEELVGVFREVRRVLRPAGTLWVECGDSYNAGTSAKRKASDVPNHGYWENGGTMGDERINALGMKPKDLLGQPWMLAFALRADGWYLRQCIIWQKPNAMPESVRDRCTTGHSYVFLLSKQPRYWFDADAISEPASPNTHARFAVARETPKGEAKARAGEGHVGWDSSTNGHVSEKNARSVWSIPTQGYAEAHFATWPEALVERILKAGCPEAVCGTCGKARERISEQTPISTPTYTEARGYSLAGGARDTVTRFGDGVTRETVGWSDCGHGDYRPGVALDPFMGSGTTALVARRLGRSSIGVELNPEYCAMAARRLSQLSLLAEGAA